MSIRKLYIAGPYSSNLPGLKKSYIESATMHGFLALEKGWLPIIPHWYDTFVQINPDLKSYEWWCAATLDLLSLCDAAFFLPGWRDSNGSMGEYRKIQRVLQIPFWTDITELPTVEEFIANTKYCIPKPSEPAQS